ncbi:MAG: NAD-dependent epimerase/dehydratase family protein [Chloroflexi bacterium]|nr:NAD-dependent epimerase/dehydratase family protein [Chloroflexota bacterium]
MKILITGGHGFVGKSVTRELRRIDPDLSSLSRRDGLDLADFEGTGEFLRELQPDVVVNLASHGGSLHYVTEFAADVIQDNLQIALNLYRAVQESCPDATIINPIANCSYPGDSGVQVESELWDGAVHDSVLSFGNSRRTWIAIADSYKAQYGIRSINLIVPNAYGPGDHNDASKVHALTGMVLRMLEAQADGAETFEIWGSGKPIREWIYVDDIARIIALLIERGSETSSLINAGQNSGLTIKRLAELIKEAVEYDGEMVFNTEKADGAPVKQLDDKLFRSVFPDFEFTSFEFGLHETISYYRELRKTVEV